MRRDDHDGLAADLAKGIARLWTGGGLLPDSRAEQGKQQGESSNHCDHDLLAPFISPAALWRRRSTLPIRTSDPLEIAGSRCCSPYQDHVVATPRPSQDGPMSLPAFPRHRALSARSSDKRRASALPAFPYTNSPIPRAEHPARFRRCCPPALAPV